MDTEWKFRLMFFVRVADLTAARKNAIAGIFANNGSGETAANELKMFLNTVRLSTTGQEPATVLGLNTAVKLSMRDAFKALLDTLPNARYAVVANTAFGQYQENELILTNFPVTPNGQIVTWDTALAYLNAQFGLVVIPPPATA